MSNDTAAILRDIVNTSNVNATRPLMYLQIATVIIVLVKPILMYWIQAKYKADPPYEIREANGSIKTYQTKVEYSIDDIQDESDETENITA